jgi:four helix bundle protein
MRNFRNLKIQSESVDFAANVLKLLNKVPAPYRQIFQSLLLRAAISIPSNIVEGCSRPSEKDYESFLEISMSSAFEAKTIIVILQKLELITSVECNVTLIPLEEIQKMIKDNNPKYKKANF